VSPTALQRAAEVLGPVARVDAPLGALTTYRVGGRAALLVVVESDDDLALATRAVQAGGTPVLVVGKGSNLLVADAGFPGLAVTLGPAFAGVDIDVEQARVRAGGAADLPVLARRSAGAGLRGLEWAVGVPGSVGGGVRMNAGGHGSEMANRLRRVRVFDLATGQDGTMSVDELRLGYRRSALAATQVVVWAEFALEPGDAEAARAEVAEVVRWRRAHQPGGQNAGSIFTNPPDDAAGRLIEVAGCRGLRLGTAQVSTKHANFIQSEPGGSADDVAALIGEVRRRVAATTGFGLQPEVRLVGFEVPEASGRR
jgi:UDP-N-acetylmuramate dehydrogenase